jgi:hypothetical protein
MRRCGAGNVRMVQTTLRERPAVHKHSMLQAMQYISTGCLQAKQYTSTVCCKQCSTQAQYVASNAVHKHSMLQAMQYISTVCCKQCSTYAQNVASHAVRNHSTLLAKQYVSQVRVKCHLMWCPPVMRASCSCTPWSSCTRDPTLAPSRPGCLADSLCSFTGLASYREVDCVCDGTSPDVRLVALPNVDVIVHFADGAPAMGHPVLNLHILARHPLAGFTIPYPTSYSNSIGVMHHQKLAACLLPPIDVHC